MATTAVQSNLVRLAPLQLGEIPVHPSIPKTDSSTAPPDLLSFLLTFLDDGVDFLSPTSYIANFKHQTDKNALPSEAKVEVAVCDVAAKELEDIVQWKGGSSKHISAEDTRGAPADHGPVAGQEVYVRPSRSKPPSGILGGGEHWFARKSVHRDISSKDTNRPGNASWKEFIFGLRDSHSQHEQDFTPNLYDAHHILDWNDEVKKLEAGGKLVSRSGRKYTCTTMSIYEMCHGTPPPTNSRCFPVLVATASINENEFVAVTAPVNLGTSVQSAFYSNQRNLKEGKDQQRKSVVLGVYAAVEVCRLRPVEGADKGLEGKEIEWIMATASDAKGNLPMWVQKMSMPGMIPKDVSYFMKWIKTVPDAEIEAVKVY
jgi:hypothetical protein